MMVTGNHRRTNRARARQARAAIAATLLLPSLTGCYSYRPIWNGEPAPGTEVGFDLTDRGRVALSDRLGPGARRVVGRVASATDSVYVIDVSGVTYIDNGRFAKWNGEPISVSKGDVTAMAERSLSKSRSWLAAGLAVGALALATGLVIKGVAGPGPDTKPTGGGPQPQ
jgi:hypothetical protein